jgi:hypothetical protein
MRPVWGDWSFFAARSVAFAALTLGIWISLSQMTALPRPAGMSQPRIAAAGPIKVRVRPPIAPKPSISRKNVPSAPASSISSSGVTAPKSRGTTSRTGNTSATKPKQSPTVKEKKAPAATKKTTPEETTSSGSQSSPQGSGSPASQPAPTPTPVSGTSTTPAATAPPASGEQEPASTTPSSSSGSVTSEHAYGNRLGSWGSNQRAALAQLRRDLDQSGEWGRPPSSPSSGDHCIVWWNRPCNQCSAPAQDENSDDQGLGDSSNTNGTTAVQTGDGGHRDNEGQTRAEPDRGRGTGGGRGRPER